MKMQIAKGYILYLKTETICGADAFWTCEAEDFVWKDSLGHTIHICSYSNFYGEHFKCDFSHLTSLDEIVCYKSCSSISICYVTDSISSNKL